MQPTTLNKVVSLFLVGGVVLLLSGCILWNLNGPLTISHEVMDALRQAGPAFIAVVGGLALASSAALLGLVCEAITDMTTRRLIKRAAESEKIAGFFLQKEILVGHDRWRVIFKSALEGDKQLGSFLSGGQDHSAATGIFYMSAPDSSIAWADSHYATYVLCSNLAFVSAILAIHILVAGFGGLYSWPTVAACMLFLIPLFYAFLSLGLDRYLYTYLFTFRHSGLTLLAKAGEQKPEKMGDKAHNTDLNRSDTAL
jgi:hypothetical protein